MLNRLIKFFSGITKPNKRKPMVFIFGASKGGESAYRNIRSQYNVLGFIDNNTKMQGNKLLNKVIYAPNQLCNLNFDKIVIASDYHVEIKNQLINECQINSKNIVNFKLVNSKQPSLFVNFFDFFEQSLVYLLCNTPFAVARYLAMCFFVKSEKYNLVSLKKITWLDQLVAYKIKVFHPEKQSLSYAPHFFGEKKKSNLITIPEVNLYHFKKGVIMANVNAIIFGENDIAMGRVPNFPIEKSQYTAGFLFAHGSQNAQVKEYQREYLEKGVAIVGSNERNYYHWVIEVLSKFQFISDLPDEYNDFPILISEQAFKIDSIKMFISYFNINREIICLKSCAEYQVDELLFISPPNYFVANLKTGHKWSIESNFVRADSLEYLRNSAFSALDKDEIISTPKRVFLARKGIIRDYNQIEVFDLLSHYGFEAVYLEDLSLLQQVRLMKNAEAIIGPTGAAWTNLIFCNAGTLALCWMADEIDDFACFSDLAQFSQVQMEYLKYKVDSNSTRDLYVADYSIDITRIKQWLIAKNIIAVNDN